MKLLLITTILFIGCKEPVDTVIENSAKLADQTIKDAMANNKKLDSILAAVKYMGTRDSFIFEAHKLEVLYYQTEREKYRIKHNRLVDSIDKYNNLFGSQLNNK
jgi:hypothetical protein